MNNRINNQQGIVPIAVVILLVAGILAGTILIQQGVNFLPHAEGTVACDGQTLGSQSAESQGAFRTAYGSDAEAEWVRQHEAELAANGTPCGSGIQEGLNCKLDNKDSISSACANEIDSKSPGFVATIEGGNKGVCTRAQILSNWCASNAADCNAKKQTAVACGGSGAGGTGAGAASCPVPTDPKQSVDATYLQAKVANNIARFYAIIEGVDQMCAPADFGVGSQINEAASDGSGSGRLMLCSGAPKTEGLPDLVWNVIVNNTLTPAQKDRPPEGSHAVVKQELLPRLNEARLAVGLGEDK